MAELTTDLALQEQTYEARTYKLSDTKIEGFVDELEALKQAIYKILSTEQYEYPIYSFKYGIAWKECSKIHTESMIHYLEDYMYCTRKLGLYVQLVA